MFLFGQNLGYTFRALRKSPAVTIAAVVSLALAIGANTAIFSLINALILRSLPVRDPQELVTLSTTNPGQGPKEGLSLAMFDEIRRNQQVFSSMFAWFGDYPLVSLEANGEMFVGALDGVSGEYYSTLGIRPLLGRLITPDDVSLHAGSSASVAVLDYRCWQRRFHGDPGVLGKTIRVDGEPLTIIGVTPEGFQGQIIEVAADVTAPWGYSVRQTGFRRRTSFRLEVVGRLKPGVTLEQARAHLTALWPGIQAVTVPAEYRGGQREKFFARKFHLEPAATGNSYMRQRLSRPLAILMGLVGMVLLIACVNLANLMLARAMGRRQELGIRVALGASGWRLIRLMLTESVTLSVAGAALGLLVAVWSSRILFNTVRWGRIPSTLDPSPDLRVTAFAAGIALLTGVLFGLAPALRVLRTNPVRALQQSSRTVRGGDGVFGRLLVSGQVALSLVLVIGAMLFARSLMNLRSLDPGFRRQGVLVIELFKQAVREKIPDRAAYFRGLAEKLSQLPGVESVSYSRMGPASFWEYPEPISTPSSPDSPLPALRDLVGPGFFRLMGMRVLAGREFEWRDDENAPRVAIVSESLARRLFPAESPVGRKIRLSEERDQRDLEIVGVVNSASLWRVQSREPLAVYLPVLQDPAIIDPTVDILTSIDPSAVAPGARRAIESMGLHTTSRIQTLEERADMFLSDERLLAMLSGGLGGLALLLAAVGLYGLLSQAVTRRTPEIGIRMALGAQRGSVVRLILREVMWIALAGVAVGVPAAVAASRLISGMLFGLPANDPATIAGSAAVLLGVALLAGYLPARRAARMDPMTALRCE